MSDTIFDKIVSGEMPSRKVWESDSHLAFLTPFPNTPGLTVVVPKTNIGDDIFSLEDDDYISLLEASKAVAKILEHAFKVDRVAMVVEGTGVAYVHVKLYPLHGELGGQTNVWADHTDFTEEYRGWLTTIEGPKMSDERMDEIQQMILDVQK